MAKPGVNVSLMFKLMTFIYNWFMSLVLFIYRYTFFYTYKIIISYSWQVTYDTKRSRKPPVQ